ncbi:NAD(P)-dependent oxidoreductase [Uliginosibacterium sp. sgz301328]|uniref:NAD(P)-dependent oxidoreductase n=1 Tax=Uliginosibacterium sp. sgz301328 TaxID=3243764 RepID=UPI00359EDC7E
MKIALIGATGFVGSAVLQELLSRDHQVTVLGRSADKLPRHANLEFVQTDAYDADQVARGVAGQDAVVSAFNPGWGKPDIRALFMKGHNAIVAGLKQAGVSRFIEVGGAGSLYVAPGVQALDTPQFPAEWREGAEGARDALNSLRDEKQLQWTFVSPATLLQPGERTGTFRLGGDDFMADPAGGPGRISTADLAVAIVNELELPQHVQQRFTLAY